MRPVTGVWLAAFAAMSVLAANVAAQTTPHHRVPQGAITYSNEQPPLTVNKRSWLDPGPVVPQGSMEDYVTENTVFNQTPDQAYFRSRFGNETLPRRFELPGRPKPLVQFWTPGSPD